MRAHTTHIHSADDPTLATLVNCAYVAFYVITCALHFWFVVVLFNAGRHLRNEERKAEVAPLMDEHTNMI